MENFSKESVLLDLAKRVKKLREEKEVTQQEAYNDTGIHFARIEQGKRDISYTTFLRICNYFGISTKEFFNKLF